MRLASLLLLSTATLSAQLTASVTNVGQGCSHLPGYAATLTVPQAVVGQPITILPAGLPAADGVLWMSVGAPTSGTTLFPGCVAYVDLATMTPLVSFMTGTGAIGWVQMVVPNDPTLVGVELTLQASMTSTWMPPGALPVVTDAAHVVIGDQY